MKTFLERASAVWDEFAKLFPHTSERLVVFLVAMATMAVCWGLWLAWRALVV